MNKQKTNQELLRQLPSVDQLLDSIPISSYSTPYNIIRKSVRLSVSEVRAELISGIIPADLMEYTMNKVLWQLSLICKSKLDIVINGTGIILHTGLGRAPISSEIIDRVSKKLCGYLNVELDIPTGKRGERAEIVENLLSALTGSEASLIVNNNAAAVLIMLNSITEEKDVIISRGQQVEIGGSFRIPDVIKKSGCNMIEVGATDKTHLHDYANAIGKNTGAVLVAHTSNYKVIGFTNDVDLKELATLCKKRRVPLLVDLGSGAIADMQKIGLPPEPQVKEFIRAGVSVITFSGDKLLGGPQSGIICGKKALIKKIHKNPMYRAMRCDKITYVFLDDILRTYYKPDVISSDNLTIRLFRRDVDELKIIADQLLAGIKLSDKTDVRIDIEKTFVEAGSGSLPLEKFPSVALTFFSKSLKPKQLSAMFRNYKTPVLGYINGNRFRIDMKAVLPGQEKILTEVIKSVLK